MSARERLKKITSGEKNMVLWCWKLWKDSSICLIEYRSRFKGVYCNK